MLEGARFGESVARCPKFKSFHNSDHHLFSIASNREALCPNGIPGAASSLMRHISGDSSIFTLGRNGCRQAI
jgi:hypothetical protein